MRIRRARWMLGIVAVGLLVSPIGTYDVRSGQPYRLPRIGFRGPRAMVDSGIGPVHQGSGRRRRGERGMEWIVRRTDPS